MFERDEIDNEDDTRALLMAGFESFDSGRLTAENAYDFELPAKEPTAKKESDGGAPGADQGERGGQQSGKADSSPAAGDDKNSRERPRDDAGRFAKGEGAGDAGKPAAADPQAKAGEKPAGAAEQQKPQTAADDQQQPAAASAEPPPPGIGARAAQLWATATPEQRAYIADTEGALAKLAKPMEAVFTAAKEVGVPWDKFVGNLTSVERQLRTNPMDTLVWIAERSGVDLDELADYALAKRDGRPAPAGAQAQQQIPQQFQQVVAPLAEQVAQISSRLTQRERDEAVQREQAQAAQQAAVKREVDAFAAANQHWKTVEAEAIALMPLVLRQTPNATIPEILRAAYDRAVYANPEVRAKVAAEAAAKAAEQQRNTRSRSLESLTGHRGAPAASAHTAANGSGNLRDEIAANWAAVDAR